MLTTRQVEWAKLHDWFISSEQEDDFDGHSVCVHDRVLSTATQKVTDTVAYFSDFRELREWAGY